MKLWSLTALFAVSTTLVGADADVVNIGSRRELFVDRLLIDQLKDGVALRLRTPQEAGVALTFDQPWEGRFSAYITIIHNADARKYQMYYRGNAGFRDGTTGEVTCYAESQDGITWVKPKLGLHEINGSKDNNIMLADLAPYTPRSSTNAPAWPRRNATRRWPGWVGSTADSVPLCPPTACIGKRCVTRR